MPVSAYSKENGDPDPSEARQPLVQSTIPRRKLACVNCQQRKIKCDRKVPCANCTKSREQCVPATKVARRRRRRFSEEELLERVKKYEQLLSQNHVEFEPLIGDAIEKKSQNENLGLHSGSERSRKREADVLSRTALAESDGVHEHNPHANTQQSQDFENRSDTSEDDVPHSEIKKAWNSIFDNDDHLLFGSRSTAVDVSSLHPEPVHMFRLWQIYLENINPLLKVTHAPSLQVRVIDAAGNLSSISSTLEALLFAIYSTAILSLDADECQSIFGLSKLELLTRYQFGCEQALINSSFLRTNDRDCLTALHLYLVSARSRTNPQSLSSLLGVAIRLAQRMGIHTESALTKCAPLEAEMRRRLWWSIVLFDARIGEMADSKTTSLIPIWDCKVPLNVNDSDLLPEMKELPSIKARSGDTLFAVVRSELGDSIRHCVFHLGLNCPALKSTVKGSPQSHGSEVLHLEKLIEDKYLQFCDSENPLHFTTIWMTRAYLARCRLIEQRFQQSDSSSPQTEEQRESAISHAIKMLECDTNIMLSTVTKKFHWMSLAHFPFVAYLETVQQVKRKPITAQADHAWEAMSDNFEARFRSTRGEDIPCLSLLSNAIIQAWKARQTAFKESEQAFTIPGIVTSVRNKLAKMVPTAQFNTKLSSEGYLSSNRSGFNGSILDSPQQKVPVDFIEGYDDVGITRYPELCGQNILGGDFDQLDWSVMDWDLSSALVKGADNQHFPY